MNICLKKHQNYKLKKLKKLLKKTLQKQIKICANAADGLKTTPNSECALIALAVNNLREYARLYLNGTMQMWIDTEDSLEVW